MFHHTYLFFILPVIIGLCSSCSFYGTPYHTYTVMRDASCTANGHSATRIIIHKRIAAVCRITKTVEHAGGQFTVTCTGSDTLLQQVLAPRGDIYITEVYTYARLHASFVSMCGEFAALAESTTGTAAQNQPGYDDFMPAIIRVRAEHVAFADSFFRNKTYLFPENTALCWTSKPAKDAQGKHYYSLLALRTDPDCLRLNPATVKKTRIEDSGSAPTVFAELYKPYVEHWRCLTRDNISRSLAFVMDGKVLMHAQVNAEITSGKLSITGGYTYSELLPVKAAMDGGMLECDLHVCLQDESGNGANAAKHREETSTRDSYSADSREAASHIYRAHAGIHEAASRMPAEYAHPCDAASNMPDEYEKHREETSNMPAKYADIREKTSNTAAGVETHREAADACIL